MRGRQTACAFTGYRPEKLPWLEDEGDPRCADLKRRLRAAVEDACRQEMEHFLCGMARGCDFYFGELVLEGHHVGGRRALSHPGRRLAGGGAGALAASAGELRL